VSKEAVDSVFRAMFLLTDLRVVLRETAPSHTMDDNRKADVVQILDSLDAEVKKIRKEMVG
jgi:hypothetical protein